MASRSRFRNAISWLGLVDDDRFDEPVAERAQEDPEQPAPSHAESTSQTSFTSDKQSDQAAGFTSNPAAGFSGDSAAGFSGDNSQTVLLTTSIVLTPSSYTDIQPIADRYRTGLPTIMNLRVMSIADAKRSVDFFSGMLYALDGSIRRVAKGVFLLEPLGVALDPSSLEQSLANLR